MSERMPYPGLRPFLREETDIFFGREQQADALLEVLEPGRFLAMVGPSGCGKSSLARAGLIAGLETGYLTSAGARWRVAVMRPGNHPLLRLAGALTEEHALRQERGTGPEAVPFLYSTLKRGPRGLVEVLHETPLQRERNLLVLVDQFEEIFRFRQEGDVDHAEAFVALLLASAEQRDVPIYVAITMRSDFLGDCALFRGLPEALNGGAVLTPRLTRAQREAAIVGPARVFQGDVEPGLVNTLLNDMGPDADQLPLMQHCLMRMWDRARKRTRQHDADGGATLLTLEDYRAVGGLNKALSLHADEAFDELNDQDAKVAEIMFRRLSERGPDRRDVRRPAPVSEIAAVAGVSDDKVREIVEVFRRPGRRFVTPGEPEEIYANTMLDISHESLIRQWERMDQWVQTEAESADTYRMLEKTACLWRDGKAALWSNPNLEIATLWQERERPNAVWASRYGEEFDLALEFLETSEADHKAKIKSRIEAERRELEETKLRNQQLRRTNLSMAAALALVVLLAIGLIWVVRQLSISTTQLEEQTRQAVDAKETAESATRSALSATLSAEKAKNAALASAAEARGATKEADRRAASERRARIGEEEARSATVTEARRAQRNALAAASIAQIDVDPQRSLLLAMEAGLLARQDGELLDPRLANALHRSIGASSLRLDLPGHQGPIVSVAYHPGGRWVASSGTDRAVKIWDAQAGEQLHNLQGHADFIRDVEFSPDGNVLASCDDDGRVMIWDADAGNLVTMLEGHLDSVRDAEFASDGSLLATAGDDNVVILWDTSTWAKKMSLEGHTDWIRDVSFSPDGRRLATASDDSTVRIWDVESGKSVRELPHDDWVFEVAFSPDGNRIVTGTQRGAVQIWDATNGKLLSSLSPGIGTIQTLAYTADGRHVIMAAGATVTLWDVDSAAGPLKAVEIPALDLAMSPEGTHLIAAGLDGSLSVVDADSWEVVRTFGRHGTQAFQAAISPDGQLLATAGYDYVVQVRDVATGRPRPGLVGHEDFVWSVAFSPEGTVIASGSADRTVRLWDSTTGEQLVARELSGQVHEVAFSPDGTFVAAACTCGGVWLLDAFTGAPVRAFRGREDSVEGVAFNPDGTLIAAIGKRALRLWELSSGEEVASVVGFRADVRDVTFSADGRYLAVAGTFGEVPVFEVSTLLRTGVTDRAVVTPRSLAGHTTAVTSVEFAPTGSILATSGVDNTIRVWDASTGRELQRLLGHQDDVLDVSFSPDGSFVATTSYDGSVRIWDIGRVAEVRRVRGHTDKIGRIAVVADNSRVLTSGHDGMIRAWERETGAPGRSIEADDPVLGVGLTAGGATLVTAGWNGLIQLWNTDTWQERASFSTPSGAISVFAMDPDGSRVLTGGGDTPTVARIWNLATGSLITTLDGLSGSLASAAFSPDGRRVVTATSDGTARIWDAASGMELRAVRHGDKVNQARFSSDGALLVTCSSDGFAVTWDAATGELLAAMPHGEEDDMIDVTAAAFSPGGEWIVTATDGGDLAVWNSRTGKLRRRIEANGARVRQIEFRPNSSTFATVDYAGVVRLWALESGEMLEALEGDARAVGALAFSADGTLLATARDDGTAAVWRRTEEGTSEEIGSAGHYSGEIVAFDAHPDGHVAASVGPDGTPHIWDLDTGEELPPLPDTFMAFDVRFAPDGTHLAVADLWWLRQWNLETNEWDFIGPTFLGDDYPTLLAYSPGGKYLASAHYDRTVRVWDRESGSQLHAFPNHLVSVTAVAFSGDDKMLATGDLDGFVKVWDVETGVQISELRGHSDAASALMFFRYREGGLVLASTSHDRSLRLWDPATGRELLRLDGFAHSLTSVTCDEQRQRCLVGDVEGNLHEVALGLDDLLTLAARRISRPLTDEECREYLHSDDGCPASEQAFQKIAEARRAALNGDLEAAEALLGEARALAPGIPGTASGEIALLDAVGQLASGRRFVLTGDDDAGLEALTQALQLDPTLGIDAEAEVQHWRSIRERREAWTEAREGDFEGALEALREAIVDDPSMGPEAEGDLRRWHAAYLHGEAIQSAQSGAVGVLETIDRIREIDPQYYEVAGVEDSVSNALRPNLGARLQRASMEGRISEALAMAEVYRTIANDPEALGTLLNSVCWYGSLQGYAAEVLDSCNDAVALAPEYEEIVDSRALARALTGDIPGAIEDFIDFINRSENDGERKQRGQWVDALQRGENPFTQEVLDDLLRQSLGS